MNGNWSGSGYNFNISATENAARSWVKAHIGTSVGMRIHIAYSKKIFTVFDESDKKYSYKAAYWLVMKYLWQDSYIGRFGSNLDLMRSITDLIFPNPIKIAASLDPSKDLGLFGEVYVWFQ